MSNKGGSHQPNSKNQGQKKPFSGGRGKALPNNNNSNNVPSKKEIESQQRTLLQTQVDQLTQEIQTHERDKRSNPVGIDKSYSLVRNTKLNQLEKVQDLSPSWIQQHPNKITFLPYLPHNNGGSSNDSSFDSSREIIEMLNADIAKLLRTSFQQFWCHVLFNDSLKTFLDTYLRFRKRGYDYDPDALHIVPGEDLLFKRVFCVLYRMTIWKENSADYINKDYYSKIIYENGLFDIPRLLDISILYGNCSFALVQTMVSNTVDAHPNYTKDLKVAFANIVQLLNQLPSKVLAMDQKQPQKQPQPATALDEDLLRYVLDIMANLSAFLSVYPRSASLLHQVNAPSSSGKSTPGQMPLLFLLPYYYDSVLPQLEARLTNSQQKQTKNSDSTNNNRITALQIQQTRAFILSVANVLFNECYFGVIGSNDIRITHQEQKQTAAQLIDFLAEALSNTKKTNVNAQAQGPSFYKDFGLKYGLQKSLQSLNRGFLNADKSKLATIREVLESLCGPFVEEEDNALPIISGSSGTTVSAETMAKISQVKELLPDLGDGFIAKCLTAFGNNPETVIDRVLGNQLPPDLVDVDRSLPLPAVNQTPNVSLLATRKNIFDNDEFDVLSNRTVDPSKVHIKGVSDVYKNTMEVLNDKSDLTPFRDRIKEYQYEYEDEYDDSYDNFTGNFKIVSEQTPEEVVSDIESENEDNDEENENQESASSQHRFSGNIGAGPAGSNRGGYHQPRGSAGRGGGFPGGPSGGGGRGGSGRGGSGGSHRGGSDYKSKSHNRKNQSAKKRGAGFFG